MHRSPMPRVLTTDAVAARERLAYWNDAVSDAYVRLDTTAPAGDVIGDIRVDALATLELSRVTATAQLVRRTPSLIATAAEDFFLVSIQTCGTGLVTQDGRTAQLQPGDFALYDSTRPYELRFDAPFQQYVLMLPGPALRAELRGAPELTARAVHGSRGAGHLMIEMIRTLAADVDVLEPAAATAVAQGVEHILVAGLSSLRAAEPSAAARAAQARHAFAADRDHLAGLGAGVDLDVDVAVERRRLHGGAERRQRRGDVDDGDEVVAVA